MHIIIFLQKKKGILTGNLDHLSTPWETQMNIMATKWPVYRMWDVIWLWAAIWGIPLLTYVGYNTVFIGPSTLKPIPEG